VVVPLETAQQVMNLFCLATRMSNVHSKQTTREICQNAKIQLATTAMTALLTRAQQAVTATAIANKICGNNQPAATAIEFRCCSSVGNTGSCSVGNSVSEVSGDGKKQQSTG